MSTKKLLVHEDKTAIQKTIYCLEQFIPEMSTLKTDFETLNLGSFTNEIFNKLKDNTSGQIIIQMYYESINKELDRVGIENAITRASILSAHESTITEFKEKINRFFNSLDTSFGMVELKLLEYRNGKFIIPTESLKTITERNSYYLETKEEIELFDSLNEFLKSAQRTQSAINKLIGYELPHHSSIMELIKKYFIVESNKTLTLKPTGIRELKRSYKAN